MKMQERFMMSNRKHTVDAHNYFVQSLRPEGEGQQFDKDRIVLIPFGSRHYSRETFMRVKKYNPQAENYFVRPGFQ